MGIFVYSVRMFKVRKRKMVMFFCVLTCLEDAGNKNLLEADGVQIVCFATIAMSTRQSATRRNVMTRLIFSC